MEERIKVLMVANQFPPMGGAGVQRSAKFVKYLTRMGCEVLVITKDRDMGIIDESLMDDVPKFIDIKRLKGVEFDKGKGLTRVFKKVWGKFLNPDMEIFWAKDNKWDILSIAENFRPDVIYTTSYPYSAHLIGLFLKERHPEWKWIADYRDEWTNNPFHKDTLLGRFNLWRAVKLERKVNNNVDFLIANTPRMLANFLRDMPSLITRSDFIPNGYDEEDFSDVDESMEENSKFIITHTGSLYGRRNLDEILDAITLLDKRRIIPKEEFLLRIVGNVYERVINGYEKKYKIKIERTGYVEHSESLRYLFRSDILLLLIGKGEGSGNFYTGKVFEYLRAKRPILAIVPKGVARDLIIETKTGKYADPEDNEEIAKKLAELYRERNEKFSPDMEAIEKYSRERQAEKLLGIIKGITKK